MKSCTICGAQLSDDAQFCLSCGADVVTPETDNTPIHEENTAPAQPEASQQPTPQPAAPQQPMQQPPVQQPMPQYQQPVQQPQQPMQQPPMRQQPVQQPMQQQPMQQPPMRQQPVQQPMQQQPMPQYQQPMQQQPTMYPGEPAPKPGTSNKTLLYVLIPLLVIGATVGILFATGVFSGKKDAAKTDQTEATAQVEQSMLTQDQEQPSEEENQPIATDGQNVTLCGITFTLADDYEVAGRSTLDDSEACIIVPKGATDRSNRLILRIYPNKLEGINGITNEEIGDLLHGIVDNNAGVFANKEKSGFTLDREYKIHYDDNANGSYFPHSYTYLNWTDRDGKYSRSYTEATLVKRIIVSGSAIATDEGELMALTDIYSEVVQAANK